MDEFIYRYPELELKTDTRELSRLTQSRQKVAQFKLILKGNEEVTILGKTPFGHAFEVDEKSFSETITPKDNE
eukprot:4439161-Pleurochrysis_carterae.AAC.1